MAGRITLLSSRRTKIYQAFTIILWLSIPSGILIDSIIGSNGLLFGTLMSLTYGLISFREIMKIFKLKSVTYDDYNVYVKLNGYEQIVPLSEVKDINIKDLTGIHCMELDSSHGRKKIYFKSSLWYPFNFKKVDQQVNDLVDRINQLKEEHSLLNSLEPHTIKIKTGSKS